MRRLAVLALCVWLAVLASIAVSAWFWRIHYLRPHAAWAGSSLALVFVPWGWLTVLALKELWQGAARAPAIGWWLVGATPVVWLGAYFVNLYVDATFREPLTINAPLRITGVWASSVFDIEARWRYPRWTHGRHTILLDDGQSPAADVLVSQMDEHISSMAQLLGQSAPDAKVAWVRGSLFGLQGRAAFLWAICAPNGSERGLDSRDRHEVAHSVIYALAGPDHDPPFVLVEGWAETQSRDRSAQICRLAEKQRAGESYSLAELVGPNWYGRGSGPVYWEGGPLVHYLMEHFGPEEFFAFYSGVRRATFHDDCRRILGVSWDEVERGFWAWIETESKMPSAADVKTVAVNPKWKLELAEGVDPADWQTLVEGYRAASRAAKPLPDRAAFVAEYESTHTELDKPDDPNTYRGALWAVIDGEDLWIHSDDGQDRHLISTANCCAILTRTKPGTIRGWVDDAAARSRVQHVASEVIGAYRDTVGLDAAWYLPLSEEPTVDATFHIEELTPPSATGETTWKVIVRIDYIKFEEQTRYELELDPKQQWWITRLKGVGASGSLSLGAARYEQWDNLWLPVAGTFEATYPTEKVASRMRLRPLTIDEQYHLQRQVERMARHGPSKPYNGLRRLLAAMVIVWPVVGTALVVWSMRLRIRLRQAKSQAARCPAIATAMRAPSSGPTTGIQA